MNEKLHFKMYKSGKRWLTTALGVAALTSFALVGQTIHAADDKIAGQTTNVTVSPTVSAQVAPSTDQSQSVSGDQSAAVPASAVAQPQAKSQVDVATLAAARATKATEPVPSANDVLADPKNATNSTEAVGVTNNVQLGFTDENDAFVPVTGQAQLEQDLQNGASAQWLINSDYAKANNMVIRSSFTNSSQTAISNISAALQMNDSRTTPTGLLYFRSDPQRIDSNGLKLFKVGTSGQKTDVSDLLGYPSDLSWQSVLAGHSVDETKGFLIRVRTGNVSLLPGETLYFEVPISLKIDQSIPDKGITLRLQNFLYSTSLGNNPYIYGGSTMGFVQFSPINDQFSVPTKYLLTAKQPDGSYQVVPAAVQQLFGDLPLAAQDFYLNNFRAPAVPTDGSFVAGTPVFNMAQYSADLTSVQNLLKNKGYSLKFVPGGGAINQAAYTYKVNNGPTVINPADGKPVDLSVYFNTPIWQIITFTNKDVQTNSEGNSTLVIKPTQTNEWDSLNQVRFSNTNGDVVYDQLGGVTSDQKVSVTLPDGPVDTTVPGIKHVTYIYHPGQADEVSKTLTVIIGSAPVLSGHEVTINSGTPWQPSDSISVISNDKPVDAQTVNQNVVLQVTDANGHTYTQVPNQQPGEYTVIYTYKDPMTGLTGTVTAKVIVKNADAGNSGNGSDTGNNGSDSGNAGNSSNTGDSGNDSNGGNTGSNGSGNTGGTDQPGNSGNTGLPGTGNSTNGQPSGNTSRPGSAGLQQANNGVGQSTQVLADKQSQQTLPSTGDQSDQALIGLGLTVLAGVAAFAWRWLKKFA
ncbi:KxYKxGKxW signal peptide domain-containing protein [Lacticaseibacillus brantae]|uniref:Gram-positive cocci surface proteins LPxTG domain-containing protein n=1 Tax=Lacticaseibacillus brantae DSM 23927 TaxID=1423727 RepID=A0A0R2AZ74_9LACO|nr:KxYKxGKxW signal peptide domain-containing protein [Lacticaseibacillus brantae]KRM72605.1 hypothetical protein FC34_GL000314 [Lacticaseibacillus brantae DSM 23927]